VVWKRPDLATVWSQFGHKFLGWLVIDDLPFPTEAYRPAQIPHSAHPPGDWDRPANYPIYEEREHYLATVHGFDAGGYEATVRCVDLQVLVDSRMRPRGHRKPLEERDERDMLRAVARAKKTVRHAVKTIGATHLMTLTTREQENSPESLAAQWKQFVRAYRKYTGEDFPYVAVPERHPTNPKHWHIHIAVRGHVKVNIARQIWWACCGGRGMGNIDVKHIKVGAHANGTPKGPLVKAEKIARYISKYMSKDLIFAHRPDKKRYWRSEFDLPKARRYWLKARPTGSGLNAAFAEFLTRFGVWQDALSVWFFPDGSGFWCSYKPHASIEGTHTPPF
jgi:hypothetical protein